MGASGLNAYRGPAERFCELRRQFEAAITVRGKKCQEALYIPLRAAGSA